MDVLIVAAWLCLATAEYVSDLAHVQAFIKQKKHVLVKKYRPLYHISAPLGWLNEPAAFVYFKRQYHIFYQYYPYNGAWGPMHWGHAISTNLVDWAHYPPALIPKEYYDKHGCFAGSAVKHNSYLMLFYTGNVLSTNSTDQSQNMAISSDGLIFQKYLYNAILRVAPYGVTDFRNPKVWRYRSTWYMIIGGSKDRLGHLLLYTSRDIFNWKLNGPIARSYGDMGYTWENPDLIEIDGQHVLILSAQGVQPDSYRFRNLFQTGYVLGHFNYLKAQFEDLEVSTATFRELDHGHDFYAAKIVQGHDGRRLLVGWLGMWESEFHESKDGWASMLTLVRELKLSPNGRLLMTPVREINDLRLEILENAWYSPGEAFYAGTKSFELLVNSTSASFDTYIILEWSGDRQYTIGYTADRGYVSVDRGGVDGIRRTDWSPTGHVSFRIFVDHSSIEVFCGNGDVVFSSRIYPKKPIRVRLEGDTQMHVTQYKLRRSIGYDRQLRKYLRNHMLRYNK